MGLLNPSHYVGTFWFIDFFVVKNTPGEAGQKDFDTADASSGDEGPQLGAIAVFKIDAQKSDHYDHRWHRVL